MPGKWHKIKVGGVVYPNVTNASKVYNLSPKKVRDRIRSGWSIDEAFELVSRSQRIYKNLIIDNKKFKSVKEASLTFNIDPNLVNSRLRKGWSIKEAFNLVVRAKRKKGVPKRCVMLGKIFNTKKERNEYFGFKNNSLDLIDKRILRGWSEREAVGLEVRKKEKTKWNKSKIIKGRSFPNSDKGNFKLYVITNIKNKKEYIGITISDLNTRLRGHFAEAKKSHKSKNKFHRAINKYGKQNFKISLIRNDATNFYDLGLQEINEIKLRKTNEIGYNTTLGGDIGTSKPIIINNEKFPSFSSAAEYFNIEPYLFNQRLKNGWTPEEAVGLKGKRGIQEIKLNMKTYKSLKKACELNGLKYKTVHTRIRRGWTIEQAFDFDPHPVSKYRPDLSGHKFKTPKNS